MTDHGSAPALPLGLQLYTLNDRLAADFDRTLAEVRAIGYEAVELADFCGRSPREVAASLRKAGLLCRSAHIPAQPLGEGPSLESNLNELADGFMEIGVETVVLPAFPIPERLRVAKMTMEAFRAIGTAMTGDDWQATVDLLNRRGSDLAARGLRIAYHNHNFEFASLCEGTVMDFLFANTDPALVSFELDVGWVVAAGVSPLALVDAHPGRVTQIHIKDIRPSTHPNVCLEQDPADIGDGIIDWAHLLPAFKDRGVSAFYVEREPPFENDPLTSVRRSWQSLTSLQDRLAQERALLLRANRL